MKAVLSLAIAFTLVTAASATFAASSTGTVRGDSMPNQQIIVVNEASGAIVGVMSDARGHFEAKDLPVGQYNVARASAPSKATGAPVLAGRITDVKLPIEP